MHANLPHISQDGFFQFITFRTQESTDEYVKQILEQNLEIKKEQYLIDKYLDNSKQGAYFYGHILAITKEYLLKLNKSMCEVIAFSIMPNHIHILLVQHKDLAKIIQHIKGGLSFSVNKELKRSGTLWQKDYFDKAIRDEKHFDVVLNYIQNNALKAGLIDSEERF